MTVLITCLCKIRRIMQEKYYARYKNRFKKITLGAKKDTTVPSTGNKVYMNPWYIVPLDLLIFWFLSLLSIHPKKVPMLHNHLSIDLLVYVSPSLLLHLLSSGPSPLVVFVFFLLLSHQKEINNQITTKWLKKHSGKMMMILWAKLMLKHFIC